MTASTNNNEPNKSPSAPADEELDYAQRAKFQDQTRLASTLLMVAAGLTIANVILAAVVYAMKVTDGQRNGLDLLTVNGVGGLVAIVVLVVCQIMMIVGARHLRSQNSYAMAFMAGVLAIATPCGLGFVVSFPVGIWTLGLLREPAAKLMFQER